MRAFGASPGVPAPALSAVASDGSLLLAASDWDSENSVSVEVSLALSRTVVGVCGGVQSQGILKAKKG